MVQPATRNNYPEEVIDLTHPLRRKREEYGLSIQDLSVLSDISASAIGRIEGPDNPYKTNIGVAKALADALDVPVSDLFDPIELSHLGRPPHTGKPLDTSPEPIVRPHEMLCPGCFLIVPTTIGCETCQPAAA